jgi:hypothetical protein
MLATVEQVEDLLRSILTQRDDAPIVEDPEPTREQLLEERIEAVGRLGRRDFLGETLDARAVNTVALTHGRQADAQRRVRLSSARRTKEQRDAVAPKEGILRERLDLSPWHARIELPIEGLERCYLWKPCEADATFERALPARVDFTLQRRDRPRQIGRFAEIREDLG